MKKAIHFGAIAMLTLVMVMSGTSVMAGSPVPANSIRAITTAKTRADHEGLAAYYDTEAARAEAKAKEHEGMGAAYQQGTAKAPWRTAANHCDLLEDLYRKVAKENGALAKLHRDLASQIPE